MSKRFEGKTVIITGASSGIGESAARKFAADNQYRLGEGAEPTLRAILEAARRGEGFGNARFARTLFEQALNAQALRLAHDADRPVAELDPGTLMALESADFAAGARALGDGQNDVVRRWPWQRAS